MVTLKLEAANDVGLIIETVNDRWSNVIYIKNNARVVLGAADKNYIKSRLLSYLTGIIQDNHITDHGNNKVIWIMTLNEKHAAFYGRYPIHNNKREILCIEDGGNNIHDIYLDKNRMHKWIENLSKYI